MTSERLYLIGIVVAGIIVLLCTSCATNQRRNVAYAIIPPSGNVAPVSIPAASSSPIVGQSKAERRAFLAHVEREMADGNIPIPFDGNKENGNNRSAGQAMRFFNGQKVYLSSGFSSREVEFSVLQGLRDRGYSVSRGWSRKDDGLTLEIQLETQGRDMAVCTAILLDKDRNIIAQGMGKECGGFFYIGISSSHYYTEERMRRDMQIKAILKAIDSLERDRG
jgi:hypothetical protein